MKKVKILIYVLIALILQVSIISCSDLSITTEIEIKSETSSQPYASTEQLENISSISNNYVDYKTARTLAMLELQSFSELYTQVKNAILSETPILIWKTETEPLYYEFPIINNNEIVGYITCNIDKQEGEPVAFISMQPRNYDESETRAIKSESKKIYANEYPNIAIISSTEYRSALAELNQETKTKEELYLEYLDTITEEEFIEAETTKEELLNLFYEEQEEENTRLETLWSLIEESSENLLALTDEEILNAYNEEARTAISYTEDEENKKIDATFVEPYVYYKLEEKKFSYCVPYVIDFIAHAYNSTLENGLSDTEIYNLINEKMSDRVVERNESAWNVIEDVTNNKLTFKSKLTHNFNTITKSLKNNGLPVVSNRLGGTNIFNIWGKIGHCRCVIGTATVKTGTPKEFLWIKWTSWSTNKYYYMQDNGTDAGNLSSIDSKYSAYSDKYYNNKFWEKHGTWMYYGSKILQEK